MDSIVKTTVLLTNPSDFKPMNEAYKEFFQKERPARSPAKLGLDMPGLRVGIEAIAVYEPEKED